MSQGACERLCQEGPCPIIANAEEIVASSEYPKSQLNAANDLARDVNKRCRDAITREQILKILTPLLG